MIRRLLYPLTALLWCALFLSPVVLGGLLTLRLLPHRMINVFAGTWGRVMLWLSGARLRVIGDEHLRTQQSKILVVNHRSFLDMQVISAVNPPGILSLAKKEFAYVPLFGLAMWAMGQVFVDRKNHEAARRSMARLADAMKAHPRTVLIFPEGTRSRDGQLQPFKLGAFRLAAETGAPIVPAVLYNSFELHPPSSLAPVACGDLVLVVHPPRDPAGWTEENLRTHADALHADYARWMAEGPPA